MKSFIFLLTFLLSQSNLNLHNQNFECLICGEYKGGREFFSWSTLILKPNGNYEYNESRHTRQSIKDKGRWKLAKDVLILNSRSKTIWTGSLKHKKKYFFKNQKCDLKEESILIRRDNSKLFNLAYYTLRKANN